MAFIPVRISLAAGEEELTAYNRSIELTARQLAAFGDEAGDMSEPFADVAGDMRTQIEAAFASEGATGASGPWQMLSPQYAQWKESKGFTVPMLVGLRPTSWVGHRSNPPGSQRNTHQTYAPSGAMMKSLLSPLEDLMTWHVEPKRLGYTPSSPIAGYHETGTDKMPARPPVDLSLTFLRSMDRIFVTWLAALMDRSGL